MGLKNLSEITTDSPSAAIVLASNNENIPSRKVFYSALRTCVKESANKLPFSSIKPGGIISYMLPDRLENIICFLTICRVCAVANPLNPTLGESELLEYLQTISPNCILILKGKDNEKIEKVARKLNINLWEISIELKSSSKRVKSKIFAPLPAVEPVLHVSGVFLCDSPTPVSRSLHYNPKDMALIIPTGGTTGKPKNVPLSHENILSSLKNMTDAYKLGTVDCSYLMMPLFHAHGLIGVALSTLYSKGTLVIPYEYFTAELFWKDVNQFEVTWVSAVPTIYQYLVAHLDAYSGKNGLRFIRSCGASLPITTLMKFERTLKVPVIESYIMTEAAHFVSSNAIPNGIRKPGSVGQSEGVLVKIFNEKGKRVKRKHVGEICISGPNVMYEYYGNPSLTFSSFFISENVKWFRTGDYGYLDENRYLVIVERIHEQIRYKNDYLSPQSIEAAILSHPKVIEAVVVGVPCLENGEDMEAMIVCRGTVSEKEIEQHVRRIIPNTVPRRFYIVENLPKTAIGKVQRHLVSTIMQAKL